MHSNWKHLSLYAKITYLIVLTPVAIINNSLVLVLMMVLLGMNFLAAVANWVGYVPKHEQYWLWLKASPRAYKE